MKPMRMPMILLMRMCEMRFAVILMLISCFRASDPAVTADVHHAADLIRKKRMFLASCGEP
jgi:hypothetical protein